MHIILDQIMLAYGFESNAIMGWGGQDKGDRCIAKGQLFGTTWTYSPSEGWVKVILHSGQRDTTWVIPGASRPLFSGVQARRQGHKAVEAGPNPALFLNGDENKFIPLVSDSEGTFLLVPMYPPPSQSSQISQPFYQHSMAVVNLNASVDNGSFNPNSRAWSSAYNARARKWKVTSKGLKRIEPQTAMLEKGIRKKKLLVNRANAFDKYHRKCGHCGSMKRLISFKKHGKVIASNLPPKFLREFRKPCAICLAMKKRRLPRPKSLDKQQRQMLSNWEEVHADTSGKFKVKSKQGNRYYSVFVCAKSGSKAVVFHAKRKHFPLAYLQFAQRINRHPRVLYTDKGGENYSKHMQRLTLSKDVTHIVVPKGEHHSIGPAEKAIQDLDQLQRGLSAEGNIPSNCWDIVTEHASLVNAMTCPSPTNPDITIFEDAYGRIPDLDALPTVGCFAVRLQEKPDRYDQKLDPINLAGVFLGFATFRGTYGSCILTDKQTIITARHHVAYDEDLMPRQGIDSTNPRLRSLQWLMGRGEKASKAANNFDNKLDSEMVAADDLGDTTNDEPESTPYTTRQTFTQDDESSDDDEVEQVLSQITPRSTLDIPSHTIFPPPKEPHVVLAPPLEKPPAVTAKDIESLRGALDKKDEVVDRRRSKRPSISTLPTRSAKSIAIVKSQSLRHLTREQRTTAKAKKAWLTSKARAKRDWDWYEKFLIRQACLPGGAAGYNAHGFKHKLPPRLTPSKLTIDKSLLVSRKLKRYFPGLPATYGKVRKFIADKQVYELVYDDGYIEHLPFDDALEILRKSGKRIEAEANYASVNAHLLQAAMEAFSASAPSSEFTEPSNIYEARTAPDKTYWIQATLKEFHLLQDEMGCWEIIDIEDVPPGQNLIECKWVFKVKYRGTGTPDGGMIYDKHRARIVAKGLQQRKGIDFHKSFSPTASQITIRLILALTAIPGFLSFDLDATCAFISALLPPDEQVYMKEVPGFPLPAGKCLKLRKSIYGLVQAPRAYYLLCREVYAQCGLRQLKSDECVFVRYVQNIKGASPITAEGIIESGVFTAQQKEVPLAKRVYADCPHSIACLILAMYVDNNGVRTNCKTLVDEFLAAVKADGRILLNLEGDMSWFLSVRYMVDPVTGKITADQHDYIKTVAKKWGLADCNACKLPMKPSDDLASIPLPPKPNPVDVAAYSMLVGELMYIGVNTVPTIAYAVHNCARYMTKATPQHLSFAKQILRFLVGMVVKGRKLTWCAAHVKPPYERGRIHSFADSSWADVLPSRKSTYGYYLFVNNAAFAWRSALAAILALSTAEAELISICSCATEIAYCRKLADELGFLQLKPTILYEDNQGAKALADHGHFKGRSKHYQLRWSFIQDYVQRGVLSVHYCPREHQLADINTGARPFPVLEKFSKIIYGEI